MMIPVKELKRQAKDISVLYVEDDPQIRHEVSDFLHTFFEKLTVVEDGRAGLDAFEEKAYDLVVTDIKMPRLDGLKMAKEIKKRRQESKIIVTSAFDDKHLLLDAIENSIDHYIVKPIDFSAFVIMLYRTVRLITLENEVERLNRHKQALLDYQENMVCTLKEGKLTSANKRFLDYYSLASVEEFGEKKINPADALIKEAGYFYPKELGDWANEIESTDENNMLVKLMNKRDDRSQVFMLRIGKLKEFGETIITLSNISEYIEGTPKNSKAKKTHLFFDQKSITDFFTILKHEINRSKRYSLPLALIQVYVQIPPKEGSRLNDVANIVVKGLELVDIVAQPTHQKFMVAKVASTVARAHTVSRQISNELQEAFAGVEGFRCSFGVAGLKSGDDIEDLLSRSESLLQEAKEGAEYEIKTDFYQISSGGLGEQERELIFDRLCAQERTRDAVTAVTFYKGVRVEERATIHSVDTEEGKAVLSLSDRQFASLSSVRKVYITVDDYFTEVEADVMSDSPHEHGVTLENLAFVKGKTPLDRRNPRVLLPKQVAIKVDDISGVIRDISVRSMACTLPSIKGFFLGKMVRIDTELPLEKGGGHLLCDGEVYTIEQSQEGYRAVFLLSEDKRDLLAAVVHEQERKLNEALDH